MLSIWWLCVWKVRSTPTPWEILRTVKAEPRPRLRLPMTTPSKACRRSRSPSWMRTCTTTVSPGPNSGTLVFICACSIFWMILLLLLMSCCSAPQIVNLLFVNCPFLNGGFRGSCRPSNLFVVRLVPALVLADVLLQQSLLLRAQLQALQQVGPLAPGNTQALLQPPACDPCVVAAEQDLWHPTAFEHFRPRVVRVVQKALGERILHCRCLGAQGSRLQADHCIQQGHRGQLAAAEDKVSQRTFFVDQRVKHAFVDPFVTSAEQ